MKKIEAEELVRKVADFLEGDWQIKDTNSSWQILINDAEGRGIYFSGWDEYQCKPGKFGISGQYPTGQYQRETISIGVSFKKEPIKIAADIEKRFFPKYNEIRNNLLVRIDAHEKWKKHNEEVLSSFLSLLREEPRRGYNGKVDWENTTIKPHYKLISSISLFTSDKDTIGLELTDLSVELATEVIQLLLAREKPEPIFLRQLDGWTAMTLIIKAVKARFGVEISRDFDKDAINYVTSHWSHYQLHLGDKAYDIFNTTPGVDNLGIDFEEAELRKAGME